MGVIFATGVWVGLASGQVANETVMKTAGNDSVFVSVISLGELVFGVESCSDASERARQMAIYRQFESVPVLEVSRKTASSFGLLAAATKQAGRSPRPRFNDLWIAAQAIEHSFPLLTTNPSDFQNLPGLVLKAI
ncbi:MAG: type II toxin-antitoxin system VapC family toxin [Betaproteobacteria bacterium]|nr:type II toxin-antitoxin system VapC family toxin [Betaproteobacteria bacterium]